MMVIVISLEQGFSILSEIALRNVNFQNFNSKSHFKLTKLTTILRLGLNK